MKWGKRLAGNGLLVLLIVVTTSAYGNFIDNGDGTVTDPSTGLMWQEATAPGTYIWDQALSYCESLTLAGYEDWRLPAFNELYSLVDYSMHLPVIDTTYFPDTEGWYWSSGTGEDCAMYLDFTNGPSDCTYKLSNNHVRAVRGGQSIHSALSNCA